MFGLSERCKNLARGAGLGIAGAAIGLAGCSDSPHQEAKVPSVTRTAESSLSPLSVILQIVYPELVLSSAKLQEKGMLTTTSDIPTEIYNFTQKSINRDVIRGFYLLFDNFPAGFKFPYSINGESRLVIAGKRDVKERTMVFIPESGPKPSWKSSDGKASDFNAGTVTYKTGDAVSFVEFGKIISNLFKTPEGDATISFATEICQEALSVQVLDENGRETDDIREHDIAQEVLCNSLGIAAAAKSLKVSYETYQSYVNNHGITFRFSPKLYFPYIVLGEKTYGELPVLGEVLN